MKTIEVDFTHDLKASLIRFKVEFRVIPMPPGHADKIVVVEADLESTRRRAGLVNDTFPRVIWKGWRDGKGIIVVSATQPEGLSSSRSLESATNWLLANESRFPGGIDCRPVFE